MSRRGFKRPMLHHPEAAGVKTRSQVMMEQLGLTENTSEPVLSASSSSDEEEVDIPSSSSLLGPATPVKQENQQLSLLLQETRRKLRHAQTNLADSEQERERRLKLMRKTHKSVMAHKQTLIQDLQDVITDKDEYIASLEAAPGQVCSSGDNGLGRLVQRISQLQKENESLTLKKDEAIDKAEQLQKEREKLEDELVMYKETPLTPLHKTHMARQVKQLQDKLEIMEDKEEATSSTREKELQEQVEELTKSLEAVKHELLQVRETLETTSEELCQAHKISSSLKLEGDSCRAQLAAAQEENGQLLLKMRKVEALRDDECSSHSSTKQELDSAHQRIHQQQLELTKLREEMREATAAHRSAVLRVETECGMRYQQLSEQCSSLHQQLEEEKASRSHLHQLTSLSHYNDLHRVSFSVDMFKRELTDARSAMLMMTQIMQQTISSHSSTLCERIEGTSKENKDLFQKYRQEVIKRRKLHNQVVELRGNIRVLCRVRPTISEDGDGPAAEVILKCDPIDEGLVSVYSKNSWKRFEVDQVFGPSSSQQKVFTAVEDLITSCMDGYNVCIFAYGQTGSGKTYTMEGPPDSAGINHRALRLLFTQLEEREAHWSYSIRVSVLEVYNESVRDLLSEEVNQKLEVKQGPSGVYVPGLTEVTVTNMSDVQLLFEAGHCNRATAATKMNIQSSRSHALLCISITGHCPTMGITTHGRLNLIDLAGSERVAKSGSEGVRLQEACHINKSLSALGDVIHALRSKTHHVPYRNSRLTYLLQDSLGGDSKVLMVVCVAPVHRNVSETVCSLTFAQRVRSVELGVASKRAVEDMAMTRVKQDKTSSPKSRSPLKFIQ